MRFDLDPNCPRFARCKAGARRGPVGDAMRLLLVNPNTNAGTTALMTAIAQRAAPPGVPRR